MTESLEMKITVNEFATPSLFRALAAISNPRQRASMIKRLAEDALRGTIAPVESRADSRMANRMSISPDSSKLEVIEVSPDSADDPGRTHEKQDLSNGEETQFDYAFLADRLGDF